MSAIVDIVAAFQKMSTETDQLHAFHFGVEFAGRIGEAPYARLATMLRHDLLGDWLFSREAFREMAPDAGTDLLDQMRPESLPKIGLSKDILREMRSTTVPAFLDEVMATNCWSRYRVIGFSTTFQQTTASLALARRIREKYSDVTIVFGGANCEDEMGLELISKVPWIDYVAIGEADVAFPELLRALSGERDPFVSVPAMAGRNASGEVVATAAAAFRELDMLPTPDYADYFDRAAKVGLVRPADRRYIMLPFESSRGCWWGEKAHCTFCGLNGGTMSYRAKSAERVSAELSQLASRYGSFRMYAVDNIVSTSYVADLFDRFADDIVDYEMFYEVKSNLTRDELKRLRLGGVNRVQPGIESLSTDVLKMMRKGVTSLQNVNFLKWARYYKFEVTWLLLWGFSGEKIEWYKTQAELLRKLTHLAPPQGCGRIRMERFSPMFKDVVQYPTQYMRPMSSYSLVYPSYFDLNRLAYFFEYEFLDTLPDDVYEETRECLRNWSVSWQGKKKPRLTFWASHDSVAVDDSRNPEARTRSHFVGPTAKLFRMCQSPQSCSYLANQCGLTEYQVEEALEEVLEKNLMIREGHRFLTLALPATEGR